MLMQVIVFSMSNLQGEEKSSTCFNAKTVKHQEYMLMCIPGGIRPVILQMTVKKSTSQTGVVTFTRVHDIWHRAEHR